MTPIEYGLLILTNQPEVYAKFERKRKNYCVIYCYTQKGLDISMN